MSQTTVETLPVEATSTPVGDAAPPNADARLIARAQRGDLEAFDELVGRHQSKVYTVAFRLLNEVEAAQDCAQDAFIRAYHSLGNFRGDSLFSTWLYRIVTNLCLDELRRRKPTESLSQADDDEVDPLERLADTRPNPEQSLLRKERQRAVQRAIRSLDDHHRTVIVLYDLQGQSYEDIAATLGLTLGTVKSRLNRARLALKEKLDGARELFED